jgi:hypothetical protein
MEYRGRPTQDDERLRERYGVLPTPAALGYGITIEDGVLTAEVVTVAKRVRAGAKRVTLYRANGETASVRVAWNDCLKPMSKWGDATFEVI